ncbi:F-box/LRR-repeat protein At4g14096-like [Bidens hawaiensis]|uniref:F-box/LRR-repeat protein At4g14096-like n=1 Tax=Bidens hawaiensis TaxID=980011 RepID=UPI00404B2146
MNSHSNRAMVKADLISRLHDALLIQILSLIPLPDAQRTRILSKRWKNLWALLPILHLVMPFCWTAEEINRFHDLVDQALDLPGNIPIQRFYLYCSKNCSYDRVSGWLRKVVQCKVQELELRFPADRFAFRLCWDLFKTCTTLVKSDLRCPVLEELFVERQLLNGLFDNMDTFEVISTSLKTLRISFALCVNENLRVAISAPNLEYLRVLDFMSSHYSLTKPSALTEAHINVEQAYPGPQIVRCLTSVKILTLNHRTLMSLSQFYGVYIPKFPKVVKFVIEIKASSGWRVLLVLLNKMPNLEDITFSDGFYPGTHARALNESWNPPAEVPACLRCKMKEIIIDNQETVSPEQFELIRYLLNSADKLESLTMNARTINTKMREQVLNLYRSSKSCRIQFV